eukprot:Amastigsp_a682920_4.p7 type:complete len:112 gc:universal Amastigsp_a682920_4:860-1195(+)
MWRTGDAWPEITQRATSRRSRSTTATPTTPTTLQTTFRRRRRRSQTREARAGPDSSPSPWALRPPHRTLRARVSCSRAKSRKRSARGRAKGAAWLLARARPLLGPLPNDET